MSSWAKRRKTLYASAIGILLVGAVIVPGFLLFYNPPSCNDGVRNGSEQGVDCGGSCQKLCQSSFLPASVAWTRFEEVAPQLYNVAAYLVNPNTAGESVNAPYHFVLYDSDGFPIIDQAGTVTLPPHRNTLAFIGAVNVGKRIPAKALFEFTSPPQWRFRTDPLMSLAIGEKKYEEDANSSTLSVTLRNRGLNLIGRLAVYAILYDASGNALGFSKTIIDEIAPNGEALAPFTWPRTRDNKVISIEVLPVAE